MLVQNTVVALWSTPEDVVENLEPSERLAASSMCRRVCFWPVLQAEPKTSFYDCGKLFGSLDIGTSAVRR